VPRYRFRWENLPTDLLDALVGALHLDGDDPAAVLAARYGVRPKVDLVRDAWPVLRDTWLAHSAMSRRAVVRVLRAHKLGDRTIDVSTVRGQNAYLHTCRNSNPLRTIVLDQLVHTGETSLPLPKRRRTTPAWATFERDLAVNLAALDAGQVVVVSVRGSGTERSQARRSSQRYVQLALDDDGGVRVEAVSNAYLTGSERLTERAVARLGELGWHAPTHAPDAGAHDIDLQGSPNYFVDVPPPVHWLDVATFASTALRDVYGATHPGFLQYSSFDRDGNRIVLPTLGIEPEPPAPGIDADHIAEDQPEPRSPAELLAAVEDTLRPLLSDGGFVTDEDGDIVIGWGSVRLFVRVLDDAPIVRVLAFALADIEPSPALLDSINEINLHYPFLKAVCVDDTVVLSVDVPGTPFVGWHLVEAIARLGTAADEVDDELEHQFGIPTLPPGTGGYL